MKIVLMLMATALVLSACSSPDPKQAAEAKKQRIIWQQEQAQKSYEEMDKKTGH